MTTSKPKPQKKYYEIVEDGFLFGDHYKAGDIVELYPAQAQYDLPPHGSMLRDPDLPADIGSRE